MERHRLKPVVILRVIPSYPLRVCSDYISACFGHFNRELALRVGLCGLNRRSQIAKKELIGVIVCLFCSERPDSRSCCVCCLPCLIFSFSCFIFSLPCCIEIPSCLFCALSCSVDSCFHAAGHKSSTLF